MKSLFYLKLLLFSTPLFFGSVLVEACMSSKDPKVNFFLSYEQPYLGIFNDGISANELRPTIIDQCQQSSSQFLMIALTLKTLKQSGKTSDISFNKKFRNDHCEIVNNPFSEKQTFEDKLVTFENQYKILRTCTFYDVIELNDEEIQFPVEQPSAKIKIISKSHLQAEGDFLYLKIRSNNRFSVNIGLKKECTNKEFIKKNGIHPEDVQALLNTYIAGDASGLTTDLTPIGSNKMQFSLTPGSDLFSTNSKKIGKETPAWPVDYKVSVEFGNLVIKNDRNGMSNINFSLLANNFGKRECVNGICSSENSYQMPVAGKIEFFELNPKNKKNTLIEDWFFGAVAPSQYQGFLESLSKNVTQSHIKSGQSYKVEMSMVDPYEDYLLFKNAITQMLINLNDINNGVAGLDILQSLTSIGVINGIRSVEGLSGIVSNDADEVIRNAIKALSPSKQNLQWPPFYDKICIQSKTECVYFGKQKIVKKISVEFTLGELKSDNSYELKDVKVLESTPFGGLKQKIDFKFPQYNCSIKN